MPRAGSKLPAKGHRGPRKRRFALTLDAQQMQMLEALAKESGYSKSDYLRHILYNERPFDHPDTKKVARLVPLKVELTAGESTMLRILAAERGVTETALVRSLVRNAPELKGRKR